MMRSGKNRNTAVTAVARELACFLCGMMLEYSDTENQATSQK